MREHVRHRETVALVERQAAHALLVVPGLAHDRLDLEQLRHVAVVLAEVGEDPRAVARAARAPVHREETQVEQVGKGEGEGQGDHVVGPVLARRQGRIDPREERDLVHLGALQELWKGDLLLGREGTLVDFLDFVSDWPFVGHRNLGEVGHGISLAARSRAPLQAVR